MLGTAHLFITADRGAVTSIAASVTRMDGVRVTLRCLRNGAVEAGLRCVVALSTEAGQKRARAVVEEVTDLSVSLRLEDALETSERRVWPRADVVLRYMARRLDTTPLASRRRAAPLSLVPEKDAWHVEEVVLSATGIRLPLEGDWKSGDLAELRLHVPGRAGGDHFVTTAEVVRIFDDESPVEFGLRFLDLGNAERVRIGEIVDQSRLSDLFEDAW